MPKSKKRVKKVSRAKTREGAGTSKNSVVRLDATTVRRSPKIFQIAPEDIFTPEWMVGEDPIFASLHKKFLLGRIPGFATRVPMEMIQEGFYLPSRGFEYLCDAPPEDIIQEQMLDIRQGSRRPLHLYANQNPNAGPRFLCPDDVCICIAYRRLGMRKVPAIVFSPGCKSLPESSFEAKVFPSAKKLGPRISGLVSAERPTMVATILGTTLPSDALKGLEKLSSELRTLVARLRLFHLSQNGQLHYHHMIFSAVVRAQETMRAIELLVEQNLWYQALALLRVLYEIHLNFFFDWLQPESNYKYLAIAAALSTSAVAKAKRKLSIDYMAEGLSASDAEEHASIVWKPVNFATTVSEKARLPKVGILFHKEIYSFLSQVSHQDFEVASLHANRFDDEAFLTIDDDLKSSYLRFMDLIVSEFVDCVDSDIGTPPRSDQTDQTVAPLGKQPESTGG
ncbi:hypothetical protein HSX11_18710 [Oxalobacteraceae bacterium]|nr:hypothetical protein [Oxalobacteraceae bacterium]